MAVPGRPDRSGGFDAEGRNHGVAQRDQRLLPRGWIEECPPRQLAHARLFRCTQVNAVAIEQTGVLVPARNDTFRRRRRPAYLRFAVQTHAHDDVTYSRGHQASRTAAFYELSSSK